VSRTLKIIAAIAGTLVALALILYFAATIAVRTERFREYVRSKIISSVEASTGGRADVGPFMFDPDTMTATVDDFVIHGTEPPGSPPLFSARRIVLKLRLLQTFTSPVVLEYLGIEQPSANVVAHAGGGTNIPRPQQKSSSRPALERVVDLAIRRVEVTNGLVHFLDQQFPLDVHGRDLRLTLSYQAASQHYNGQLSLEQILANSPGDPPVDAHLTVPLVIGADSLEIRNAKIATPLSAIQASISVEHMAAPKIAVDSTAHIDLAELSHSIALPIHPKPGATYLDGDVAMRGNQIQQARLTLGHSQLSITGNLTTGATFSGSVDTTQVAALLDLKEHPSGQVRIAGTLQGPPWRVAGRVDSKNLSFQQARNAKLSADFQLRSGNVEVSNLSLRAFGGELRGSAAVQNQSSFVFHGNVRDFSIRELSAIFLKQQLNYAGNIGGSIGAGGRFGGALHASADLAVAPGHRGIPVSGRIDANYDSANGMVVLNASHISLPHSRIRFSGRIGQSADATIASSSLADFSPLFNAGSAVHLRGGLGEVSVHEGGPLSDPHISGRVRLSNFKIEDRSFDRLAADFQASPAHVAVENGVLNHAALQARFSGALGLKHWSIDQQAPLQADFSTSGGSVADFLALAGSNLPISGPVNAVVAIGGTVANPQGTANMDVGPGLVHGEPFDKAALSAQLSDQRVDLRSLYIAAGPARLDVSGTFIHPRDSFTSGRVQAHVATDRIDLSRFKTLRQERPGLAGEIMLRGDVMGEIRPGSTFLPSAIDANLSVAGLRDARGNFGDLQLNSNMYGSELMTRLTSDFAGSRIRVTAQTALRNGYPTSANASVEGLSIERSAALLASQSVPASGTLSMDARFEGTWSDPHLQAGVLLSKGAVFDEPLTRAQGQFTYSSELLQATNVQVVAPAGTLDLDGSYAHAKGDLASGRLTLHARAPDVALSRIRHVEKAAPGLSGIANLDAGLAGELHGAAFLPASVEVSGKLNDLRLNGKQFGSAALDAHTAAGLLRMNLNADLAGASIRASGRTQLSGDYAGSADVSFANVEYSSLAGLIGSDLPLDASVEGKASFSGPFRNPLSGTGNIELSQVRIAGKGVTAKGVPNGVAIHNDGPVSARLEHAVVRVEHAVFIGPTSSLDLSGTAGLAAGQNLALMLDANVDLGIVRDFSPGAFVGGTVAANARIGGTFTKPQVTGRVDLKDASLQLANWPNGISNANGAILLNGSTARVNSITGRIGGGKVVIDGRAGFTGAAFDFDLRASAQQVRTRYSGASVTANAALTFGGTSKRSSLGGTITITRVGYSQESDLGAILAGAGPPSVPPALGLESRIRLNVRIQTSPGVAFRTDLAEQLSASADLNLLGNAQSPGMVGRFTVNSGTLIFFGNKYSVDRGSVSFYNATAIQPVLDVDLETSTQGVTVNLSVSGPIDHLKLSYRSDPPLTFDQIVALLATGRTPPDPTIAVNQPYSPDQSGTQMGESAILSQAIANPVSSRLQRVFGVTALKIAPTFVNGSSLPQARITVQQQVSTSVTLTYSQDLNQANSQLIRIEVALNPRFSAVATRDENGIFGVDFFYKKQFH
jgi:translocation and assembly module TamB